MSIRELEDAANRARALHYYRESLSLYRSLCKLEPTEAHHPHRAGEVAAKLGDQVSAVSHFHVAAILYARSGFLARAIALLNLTVAMPMATDEVRELLRDLLTIRETRAAQTSAGTAGTAKALTAGMRPAAVASKPVAVETASVPAVLEVQYLAPLDWMGASEVVPSRRGAGTPSNPSLCRPSPTPPREPQRGCVQEAQQPLPQQASSGPRVYPRAPGEAMREVHPNRSQGSSRCNPGKD